jgi:hypothetical protein
MEQLQILREGIDHNYWARDRHLQACVTRHAGEYRSRSILRAQR